MMRGRGLVAAGVAAVVLFGAAACGGRSVPVASARSFVPAKATVSRSCPDAMADGVWDRLALSQYGEDDDGDGRPDAVVLPAGMTWCKAVESIAAHCVEEDGSGQAGVCVWDAHADGNRQGNDVILYRDGVELARW